MLSNFSVKKPYTVIVAVVFILVLGFISVTNMTTDLLPSLNLPYAVVSTSYVGASPEEVETVVTRPIEQRMASISNIKNIQSVSSEHISMVILEFNETTNMDAAVIEMRESLDMVKANMPDGIGSPIIMKLNPNMMPIMALGASLEDATLEESTKFIETIVIPELESVEGVASVNASGMVENVIHVVVNEDKIKALQSNLPEGVTLPLNIEMIENVIQGQNFSMPTGYVTDGENELLVRTGDKIDGIEALSDLVLFSFDLPGMTPIVLSDVAEILTVDNSGDRYSKINGNDSITISLQKQTEFATSQVSQDVRAKIQALEEEYPGTSIVTLLDQGEYIDIVVNSISMNLIYGGLLAILILIIFLRDLRPTLVVALSIPISVVSAFVLMYFTNITLNIISMGGLALGVGMLVDNSIVVIENIYRMRNEGLSAKEASIQGARQVSGAILASTLTTMAVFLPIVFTEGLTRQIFADMGLTIAFSLTASLVVALTLVPMLASKTLSKEAKAEHHVMDKLKNFYLSMLKFSLKHKISVILLIIVLFAGSIYGAIQTGAELFPASDVGQITVNLELPKGTTFDEASESADALYEILEDLEDVETIGASIGNSGMGPMMMTSNNQVSYNIILDPEREKSTQEISQIIRDKTEDFQGEVLVSDGEMMMMGLGDTGVGLTVTGRDFDVLSKIAKDLADMLSKIEGTTEISNGLEETASEIKVTVDKNLSIAKGLTVATVFMPLREALSEAQAITSVQVGNNDLDVIVKSSDTVNYSLDDLNEMTLESPYGQEVLLKDIASIENIEGFTSINRNNQQRYLTVTSGIQEGYNIGIISREVEDKIAEYEVPEGYNIKIAGEQESINEAFTDLFLMLAAGILFIYLIMVAQFQSLRSPFIVMFTIPLAFTGGFLALILTQTPLSMVSMIGLIILTGIVVNNGIVFVDYVNKMREDGLSKFDAIIKTGKDRMRPIMMTALTTIFALSTLSLGAGEGTEMMQPMAITAIGGLIYATLLTLIFIPVLYDVFHKGAK